MEDSDTDVDDVGEEFHDRAAAGVGYHVEVFRRDFGEDLADDFYW
jgi:hypothetical protein